ncbi:TonB-dependent receptor plug domain-containing protein, partial [Streptomyces scabiei]|uniref:TonB-dependent receptor plug domain-containing protein n=1 Tax=Streptomyces scabiei TaxID=1930 RepID=UPI0038F78EA1
CMTINITKFVNIILIYSAFYALHGAANNTPQTELNQLETIQIRGYHDSAVKSLLDKRDSQSIIDTISAQDIGKFPDKNVAEALQRVTGISLS